MISKKWICSLLPRSCHLIKVTIYKVVCYQQPMSLCPENIQAQEKKMGIVWSFHACKTLGWQGKYENGHLAAAAFIEAEEDATGWPGRSPLDPGKPGGIPLEGGRNEEPGGNPPLGNPGPFPCAEACIAKEWGGISPLAVSLSHKSKGLPHTIGRIRPLNLNIPKSHLAQKYEKTKKHIHIFWLAPIHMDMCMTMTVILNSREPVRELSLQVRRIYFGGSPLQNWEMAIPWDGWGVVRTFCSCTSVCTQWKVTITIAMRWQTLNKTQDLTNPAWLMSNDGIKCKLPQLYNRKPTNRLKMAGPLTAFWGRNFSQVRQICSRCTLRVSSSTAPCIRCNSVLVLFPCNHINHIWRKNKKEHCLMQCVCIRQTM